MAIFPRHSKTTKTTLSNFPGASDLTKKFPDFEKEAVEMKQVCT